MAVSAARRFLRSISQPFAADDQEGVSIWSMDDLRKHQEKMAADMIVSLQAAQAADAAHGAAAVRVVHEDSDYEMNEDEEAEMMALGV